MTSPHRSSEPIGTAGSLIRRARQLTGLTQTELARRIGLPQPVISAYERGQRVPTVTTLERLIDAAGLRLTWTLTHGGSGAAFGALGSLTGPVGRRVVTYRGEIVEQLRERDLLAPRVVGVVAEGAECPGTQLELLITDVSGNDASSADHAGEARAETMRLMSAAGLVSVLVGAPVVVLTEERALARGLTPEELSAGIALSPGIEPLFGDEPPSEDGPLANKPDRGDR